MAKVRSIVVLGLIFALYTFTQGQNTGACPAVSLLGPSGVVSIGNIATYKAHVDVGDRNLALTYKWTISDGKIKIGQGTDTIDVVQPNSCITATVDIAGLPTGCPNILSDTSCGDPKPESTKLVEVTGTLNKTKINLINESLENYRPHKYIQMFVVVSGNTKSIVQQKIKTLKRLFNDDPSRATFVVSKSRKDFIVVWAVPPGADYPTI